MRLLSCFIWHTVDLFRAHTRRIRFPASAGASERTWTGSLPAAIRIFAAASIWPFAAPTKIVCPGLGQSSGG